MGKWDTNGRYENREHLDSICAERGMKLEKNIFKHKYIHRYSRKRGEGTENEDKSLIDYIMVDERIRIKESLPGCLGKDQIIMWLWQI